MVNLRTESVTGDDPQSDFVSLKFANMSLLAAFMVVLIHVLKRNQVSGSLVWWVRQLAGEGFCRIAVPFFFLASGYYLARHFNEAKWWRNEIRKRLKTLLAPFLTWCCICFLLCSLMIATGNLLQGGLWHDGIFVCNRLLACFGLDPFCVPELRQLWFIRVLLVLVFVSPLLRVLVEGKKGYCWIAIFGVMWFYGKFVWESLYYTRWHSFMNFGLFSFEGLFFFSIGMRLRMVRFDWRWASRLRWFPVILCGSFALLMEKYLLWQGCPVIGLACVYIPCFLFGGIGLAPSKKLPESLCRFHFPLYLIHLNIIFVYFSCLSCEFGEKLSPWIDPGVSCLGVAVCFFAVSTCSFCVFVLLKRIFKKNVFLRVALWGGRV